MLLFVLLFYSTLSCCSGQSFTMLCLTCLCSARYKVQDLLERKYAEVRVLGSKQLACQRPGAAIESFTGATEGIHAYGLLTETVSNGHNTRESGSTGLFKNM